METAPLSDDLSAYVASLSGLRRHALVFEKVVTHRRGVALLKGHLDGQDVGLKLVLPDAEPSGPYDPTEVLSREAHWLKSYGSVVGANYAIDDGVVDGEPWLLMTWLAGFPADSWWRNSPQNLDVFTHMAERLAAVHAIGQVHGDLQPAHFLVARDGVAMLDFGLAHHPGSFDYKGGMIHFLAPEIAASLLADKPTVLDPLAEVYSFGAVVFFIVTGERPTSYTGSSIKEKLAAIACHGAQRTDELARRMPAKAAGCISACLSLSRDDRIQSMDILLDALH